MALYNLSFLFLVLFYLSRAWIVTEKGTIEKDQPLTGTFTVKSLKGNAFLNITHTESINICFQRLVALPTNYTAQACSYFAYFSNSTTPTTSSTGQTSTTGQASTTGQDTSSSTTGLTTGSTTGTTTGTTGTTGETTTTGSTSSTTTTTTGAKSYFRSIVNLQEILSKSNFSFIDDSYQFGVYFANDTSKKSSISLTLEVDSCNDDVWNGTDCVVTTNLAQSSTKVVVKPGDKNYFSFVVSDNTGNYQLDAKLNVTGTVTIWARYGGAPLENLYTYKETDNLIINTPHPGVWYVLISASNTQIAEMTLTSTSTVCRDNTMGSTCQFNISTKDQNSVKYTLDANHYLYFKVVSTTEKPLWVSAQTEDNKKVQISASLGQLPILDPDIKSCNKKYCDPVTSIKLNNETRYPNPTANQTWYVAIRAVQNSTSFSVWFDSLCIPGCTSRGSCTEYGSCACDDGYAGLDCSDDSGLQAQYIVLIIIASLVVASAVIGFISWAYMRRGGGKNSYEKVG